MDYGDRFGLTGRPIAVPSDGMVLLGNELEILDFTAEQLDAFPPFDPTGTVTITDQSLGAAACERSGSPRSRWAC